MSGIKVRIDKTNILIFCLLYFSNVTLLFGSNSNQGMVTGSRYFTMGIGIVLLIDCLIHNSIQIKNLLIFIILLLLPAINVLLQKNTLQIYLVQSVFVLVAFALTTCIESKYIFSAYLKVMYFLCFASIIIEIIGTMGFVLNVFPTITNTSGNKYYYLLLGNVPFSTSVLKRNCGIFWEPGTFSIYIIMAVFLEMFFENQYNRKHLLVFALAELLTFSTSGYACFLMIIALYILNREVESKIKQRFVIGGLIVLSVVLLLFGQEIIDQVFLRNLSGAFSGHNISGSYISRYVSIIGNALIVLENPLLGVGYSNIGSAFIDKSIRLFSYDLRNNANANTFMYITAVNGIPYGLLVFWGACKCANKIYKARYLKQVIVYIFVFVLFASENLQHSIVPYVLMFIGFSQEIIRDEERYY